VDFLFFKLCHTGQMEHTQPATKKVLIVEDEVTLRDFLVERLRKQGITVSVAVDGEEGLSKMLSERPDAAIVDIMLPKKNGFTLLDEFRAKEPSSPIRIIMLTNLDDMQYAANAIEKKAFAYIIKSDRSLEALASLIEEQLTAAAVSP
jgi:two-component system response regulator MprA